MYDLCPFIDCPVSGEAAKAADASLTMMVGGAKEDVSRALPYLNTMGSSVVHSKFPSSLVLSLQDLTLVVGDVGSGNLCKSLNNCAYNASVAVMAELLPLGE